MKPTKKFIQQCMESKYPVEDKNGDKWQVQMACDTCGGPQKGYVGERCVDMFDCGGHLKRYLISYYWWNKKRNNVYIEL